MSSPFDISLGSVFKDLLSLADTRKDGCNDAFGIRLYQRLDLRISFAQIFEKLGQCFLSFKRITGGAYQFDIVSTMNITVI